MVQTHSSYKIFEFFLPTGFNKLLCKLTLIVKCYTQLSCYTMFYNVINTYICCVLEFSGR